MGMSMMGPSRRTSVRYKNKYVKGSIILKKDKDKEIKLQPAEEQNNQVLKLAEPQEKQIEEIKSEVELKYIHVVKNVHKKQNTYGEGNTFE